MIISGNLPKHVLSQPAPELTCDSCGQLGTIDLHVISNCVHLYFIPLFPAGKTGRSTCRNCDSQLCERDMPSEMQRHLLAAKSIASTPWWQFAGVAVLGMLLIGMPLIVQGVDFLNAREGEPIPVQDLETSAEGGLPMEDPYNKEDSESVLDYERLSIDRDKRDDN